MRWHIEYGAYSFALAILYVVIGLAALFQIFRLVYYRHNILHYQFGFLVFCFVWGIIRTIFWTFLPWSQVDEYWIQGVGLIVQFGTFTLLVLFYVQLISRAQKTWKINRKLSVACYIIINILFLSSFIAVGIWIVLHTDADGVVTSKITSYHAYFIGSMYLILSLSLILFGWKLAYLVDQTNLKVPFLKSKYTIGSLTTLFVFLFISRSIKDILSGAGIGIIEFRDPVFETLEVQVLVFFLYFVWEIIPSGVVLVLFWRIPGSTRHPPHSMYAGLNPPNKSSQDLTTKATINLGSNHNIDEPPEPVGSNRSIPIFKSGNTSIKGYSTRSLLTEHGSPIN